MIQRNIYEAVEPISMTPWVQWIQWEIKVRWLGQAGQTSTRQPPLDLFPRGIMDWAPGINKNTAGTLPAVLFF